jgi:uncharacterized protein YodC (DUF2158 family)
MADEASIENDEEVAIKVGDRVNLNTDEGPDMVVSKIVAEDGVEQATCLWFEDQRQVGGTEGSIWVLKKENLPLDVLVRVEL